MGGGASAGGGRVARALRLLKLLVLALAAVEYLFGSILDASPLRTYPYTPLYNATQPTLRNAQRTPGSLQRIPLTDPININYVIGYTEASTQNRTGNNHTAPNNVSQLPINLNITKTKSVEDSAQVEPTSTSMLIQKILDRVKNASEVVNKRDSSPITLPVCESASDLGPVPANTADMKLDEVKKKFPEVLCGGRYTPPNCTAKHKVAIMVPYSIRVPTVIQYIARQSRTYVYTCVTLDKELEKPTEHEVHRRIKNAWRNHGESFKEINTRYGCVDEVDAVSASGTYLSATVLSSVYPKGVFGDRQQNLAIFLNHMHPFLMKQQIEYRIYIIEQKGRKPFNRAKLMNVGIMESQKLEPGGFQCFIFHDIDLLPLDTRNLYSCTRQPRHLSASIDRFKFNLLYWEYFGGVSAMTLEQIHTVNGFSNKYWGWGGEDDDMYYRLLKNNYHIARYKRSIARYASLKHEFSMPNPKRNQLLLQKAKKCGRDGLSTLRYKIVQVMQYHLYTHILANIDERS